MASLTKIMTAVVALENSDPAEAVLVPVNAQSVGESSSFLRAGQSLPMSELLEALLVKSGNDAAVTIAVHVAGGEDAFVDLMNKKARDLGLSDTNFENSHGLDQKGHRTSARDMAVLTRYAMGKGEFREIVSRKSVKIHQSGKTQLLPSTNLLLGSYPGADGVKTGFTSKAGYCFVGSAKRENTRLYAVVMGTTGEAKRFADARELLDWGFAHYRVQKLSSAGTVVAQGAVRDYVDVLVPAAFSEETSVAVFDLCGPVVRSVRSTTLKAPISKGQKIGVATFTQRGKVVATIPLVATVDVKAPGLFERAWIGVVRLWRRLNGQPLWAQPVPAAVS